MLNLAHLPLLRKIHTTAGYILHQGSPISHEEGALVMKRRMMALILSVLVLVVSGAQAEMFMTPESMANPTHAEDAAGKSGHGGDHAMTAVDDFKAAANPLYPVGTEVVIDTDHMPGMQGAKGVVSGAFDTTLYAVDYTDADGTAVKNHRWVVSEEIEGGLKAFDVGDSVALKSAGHMESLGGAGLEAVIVQVVDGPAYMVDYDPTDGDARVMNHQWVAEFELKRAD